MGVSWPEMSSIGPKSFCPSVTSCISSLRWAAESVNVRCLKPSIAGLWHSNDTTSMFEPSREAAQMLWNSFGS